MELNQVFDIVKNDEKNPGRILMRKLARELTAEEISAVSGGRGAAFTKTIKNNKPDDEDPPD